MIHRQLRAHWTPAICVNGGPLCSQSSNSAFWVFSLLHTSTNMYRLQPLVQMVQGPKRLYRQSGVLIDLKDILWYWNIPLMDSGTERLCRLSWYWKTLRTVHSSKNLKQFMAGWDHALKEIACLLSLNLLSSTANSYITDFSNLGTHALFFVGFYTVFSAQEPNGMQIISNGYLRKSWSHTSF